MWVENSCYSTVFYRFWFLILENMGVCVNDFSCTYLWLKRQQYVLWWAGLLYIWPPLEKLEKRLLFGVHVGAYSWQIGTAVGGTQSQYIIIAPLNSYLCMTFLLMESITAINSGTLVSETPFCGSSVCWCETGGELLTSMPNSRTFSQNRVMLGTEF